MVHYMQPHGEFVICHAAVAGSTANGCRYIQREENEISRHYHEHHPDVAFSYQNCRSVTAAAASAFAGPVKFAKANSKTGPDKPAPNTPRDPNWRPTPAQVAAAPSAPPAAAAPPPAAGLTNPPVAAATVANPPPPPPPPSPPRVSAYDARFDSRGELL